MLCLQGQSGFLGICTAMLGIAFYLPFLLLRALVKAIAIACFCGFPAFISVLMFDDTIFGLAPFFSGINYPENGQNKAPSYGGMIH